MCDGNLRKTDPVAGESVWPCGTGSLLAAWSHCWVKGRSWRGRWTLMSLDLYQEMTPQKYAPKKMPLHCHIVQNTQSHQRQRVRQRVRRADRHLKRTWVSDNCKAKQADGRYFRLTCKAGGRHTQNNTKRATLSRNQLAMTTEKMQR